MGTESYCESYCEGIWVAPKHILGAHEWHRGAGRSCRHSSGGSMWGGERQKSQADLSLCRSQHLSPPQLLNTQLYLQLEHTSDLCLGLKRDRRWQVMRGAAWPKPRFIFFELYFPNVLKPSQIVTSERESGEPEMDETSHH